MACRSARTRWRVASAVSLSGFRSVSDVVASTYRYSRIEFLRVPVLSKGRPNHQNRDMHVALSVLDSSSPVVCLIFGIILLCCSSFLRRSHCKHAAKATHPRAEQVLQFRIQSNKVVPIRRNTTMGQSEALSRLARQQPLSALRL